MKTLFSWPKKFKIKLTSKVAYLWHLDIYSLQPWLPKQPRIEYSFYRFLYQMVCGHIPNECTVLLEPDSICSKLSDDVFSFPVLYIQYKLNFGLRSHTFLCFILKRQISTFLRATHPVRGNLYHFLTKWAEIRTRLT